MNKKLSPRRRRSRKTSDTVPQETHVQMVEKLQRYFITARSSKTSDEDQEEIANPVQVDTRHYCNFCKRKREERFMRKWFMAAYGKRSWICGDDTKTCLAIRKLKRGY